MNPEIYETLTRQERSLFDALQQHGILSHAILESLGFDISLGMTELVRISAIRCRMNKKLPPSDRLVVAASGSAKGQLLPVIMRSADYELQKTRK